MSILRLYEQLEKLESIMVDLLDDKSNYMTFEQYETYISIISNIHTIFHNEYYDTITIARNFKNIMMGLNGAFDSKIYDFMEKMYNIQYFFESIYNNRCNVENLIQLRNIYQSQLTKNGELQKSSNFRLEKSLMSDGTSTTFYIETEHRDIYDYHTARGTCRYLYDLIKNFRKFLEYYINAYANKTKILLEYLKIPNSYREHDWKDDLIVDLHYFTDTDSNMVTVFYFWESQYNRDNCDNHQDIQEINTKSIFYMEFHISDKWELSKSHTWKEIPFKEYKNDELWKQHFIKKYPHEYI